MLTMSPLIEEQFMATPEGEGRKPYPIYKQLDGGMVLVPRVKQSPASATFTPKKALPFKLRPYQAKPVMQAVETLKSQSGFLLRAACGTGKTVMAIAICELQRYKSVIVLVDQVDIANQWQDRINEFLPKATVAVFHGKAESVDTLRANKARFKIVVAQSLMKKDWDKPAECDMLVCDEAHVFSAPCFCGAIYNLDYHHSMALTATDDRKDGLTWVFMQFLAGSIINVSAKTMQATVLSPRMNVDTRVGDYNPAWCNSLRGMTWKAKCTSCEHFDKFPVRCGGGLPLAAKGVKWNKDKIMWTPLLSDTVSSEKYLKKFLPVIKKFHKAGRQLMVFGQFVQPLKDLMALAVGELGEDACGLYVSGTKNVKEVLDKPITFTTYKMSQKALDVPWKDAMIMTSPISDIRQTVGRITRLKDGKRAPVVFDPVIDNVFVLRNQYRKRLKQYLELGFKVTQK